PDDPNAPADQRKQAAIEVGGSFAAGNVSFAYKVISEQNFDFIEFFIDGQMMLQISGNAGWTTASFPISAGNHILRWAYDKDASFAAPGEGAWIDTVVLPGVTVQQPLAVSRNGTGNGTVVSNPGGITCGGICYNYFS